MSLPQTNFAACLADLSGSMNVRDERGGLKRIEQVSPHLDGEFRFMGEPPNGEVRQGREVGVCSRCQQVEVSIMERPELGEKTALETCWTVALQDLKDNPPWLGRCFYGWAKQQGKPFLEVAKNYVAGSVTP